MRFEFFLARRYLFRGKAHHISFIGIISCVGVIVGVAAVIVAISIVNGIDGGLMERIMRFKYHLTIEAEDIDRLALIRNEIEEWEEVDVAALTLQTQVFAKLHETIVPLVVMGMDFNNPREKAFFYQYVKKEIDEEGFFVGEGLQKKFFLNDKIEFYPLQRRLALKEAPLRGSFQVGLYDVDNFYLITDLEEAEELSPHHRLFLGLRVKRPFAVKSLKARIEKEFPKPLLVDTWIDTNQAIFATLKLEKLAMFIILTLIIIVASFNIFATLTVKVVEKTKDIGVLRSLGISSTTILVLFSLQGILLGFIGVFLGSVLGVGMSLFLKKYPLIRIPEEIFFTPYLPITINYWDVALIIGIGLVLSFLSSLLPAIKASRLSPVDALRYE